MACIYINILSGLIKVSIVRNSKCQLSVLDRSHNQVTFLYIQVSYVHKCYHCQLQLYLRPGGIKSKAITKSKQKLIYLHLPNDLLTI